MSPARRAGDIGGKRNEYMAILLHEVLNFDRLLSEYQAKDPKARIKLRFNENWYNTVGAVKVLRDQLVIYKDDRQQSMHIMYSLGKEGKKRLRNGDLVFQFLEIKNHQWLLVDASYITDDVGVPFTNPVTNMEKRSAKGTRLIEYMPYFERLIVNFKQYPQQFFYVDEKIIKAVEVEEILPKGYFDISKFNGYENVNLSFSELKSVLEQKEWQVALQNQQGVYLLIDRSNGKQYVGSATGLEGIFGRWNTYVKSKNHAQEDDRGEHSGGNKRLKDLGGAHIASNFSYIILEVFSHKVASDRVYERESWWKNALHTKEFGYNEN